MVSIKAGDKVRLRTGGPAMTVEVVGELAFREGRYASCQWFDREGTLQRGNFRVETLEDATDDQACSSGSFID
jgi:uncharacterized protein YodC (DUF2158 family)